MKTNDQFRKTKGEPVTSYETFPRDLRYETTARGSKQGDVSFLIKEWVLEFKQR